MILRYDRVVFDAGDAEPFVNDRSGPVESCQRIGGDVIDRYNTGLGKCAGDREEAEDDQRHDVVGVSRQHWD